MVGTQSQTARAVIAAEVATQVAAHLATAAQQQQTITQQNQYVPTNPDVDFEKVAKQFINKRLPICVDEPTYIHYVQVRNMLYRNLRQIKSPFGSGKHGHLSIVTKLFSIHH